jgi:hypothetical protein
VEFVWERGANSVPSNFEFVFAKNYFFMFSDHFDVLISKMIFKK